VGCHPLARQTAVTAVLFGPDSSPGNRSLKPVKESFGALGRRFESCRPDHSHSKGSRPFRGPSFLACFGGMCARCAQKNPRVPRCSVFCAQTCAEPGDVPTWLDLSLRMVWVASPASTWPAPADAICHHQPGPRLSERHGHPNHPDVGMRPPRPRLSRSE